MAFVSFCIDRGREFIEQYKLRSTIYFLNARQQENYVAALFYGAEMPYLFYDYRNRDLFTFCLFTILTV